MYIEKQYIINENDEFFIVYERDNHYNGSVIAITKVPETPGQQRQLKRYLENYGYVDRVKKQKFMIKIPYDDKDTINERGTKCTVTIEGTNLELIKYIQAIVFGTFKSYYYNGIPDEWERNSENEFR